MFPTAPGLDQDLGSVGMLLDSFDKDISESMEFSDYYSNNSKPRVSESGEITPVSGSEVDFNTNDATMGSSADCDITVTEDIDGNPIDDNLDPNNETITSARANSFTNFINSPGNSRSIDSNNLFQSTMGSPKLISPLSSNINLCTNVLNADPYQLKHVENVERLQPCTSKIVNEFDKNDLKTIIKKSNIFDKEVPNVTKNLSIASSDKWSTSKEKFLENKNFIKTDNIDFGKNLNLSVEKKVEKDSELTKMKPGAVLVKETYIEPLKISRVSKSFHGQSPTSSSQIDMCNIQRRSSDSPLTRSSNLPMLNKETRNVGKEITAFKTKMLDELSQPGGSGTCDSLISSDTASCIAKSQRFTTIKVEEAEHAASIAQNISRRASTSIDGISSTYQMPMSLEFSPSNSTTNITLSSNNINNNSNREHEKITKSVSDNSTISRRRDSDK